MLGLNNPRTRFGFANLVESWAQPMRIRRVNKEILMVADAVSNEKGVDKEVIFEALEPALPSATRKKHGEERDARVSIDRKSGDYDTFRRSKVFADDTKQLEVPARELRLQDALQ